MTEELFKPEEPKRPKCCPKCGSVNILKTPNWRNKELNIWMCNDCGNEIK